MKSHQSLQVTGGTTGEVYKAQRGLSARIKSQIAGFRFGWGRLAAVTSLLMIAAASIAALIYCTCVASSQFMAETQFTVRAIEPVTMDAKSGQSGGLPTGLIVQDTLVIVSYLKSRSLVEQLEKDIDLRHFYTYADIDYFNRLAADAKIEDFVKHWDSVTDVSVQANGIVTFSVRAFSPEDAVRIAQACVDASERILNQMKTDMLSDSVTVTEKERKIAEDRLNITRAELEKVRNRQAIIDPAQSEASQTELINAVRGKLLATRLRHAKAIC